MKRVIITLAAAASLFALVNISSCEKYVLPELTISCDTLLFSAAGGSQELAIESNVAWRALFEDCEWAEALPDVGEGNATIEVKCSPNDEEEPRTVTLGVKSETIHRSCIIIQESSGETTSPEASLRCP